MQSKALRKKRAKSVKNWLSENARINSEIMEQLAW
jgi:hypothetical protein